MLIFVGFVIIMKVYVFGFVIVSPSMSLPLMSVTLALTQGCWIILELALTDKLECRRRRSSTWWRHTIVILCKELKRVVCERIVLRLKHWEHTSSNDDNLHPAMRRRSQRRQREINLFFVCFLFFLHCSLLFLLALNFSIALICSKFGAILVMIQLL